ncbi:DUF3316 domain-containing protein [Enterovibrio paralichthyis]|uniref:DUF3316 domain-containing protein n=1 Tax=Enterovibrio paralichthyis TaxID=2853805 RepID=UPI0006D07976|nr:DUF3316 domain-containing protein [Enterovibrio paralichthyis]MBV7299762.1 DUF3316 domain-containing protein [Enterovibrio paralichthyis]
MKTLTHIAATAAIVLASTTAIAEPLNSTAKFTSITETRSIEMPAAENKQDAYDWAYVQLQNLQSQTPEQLKKSLKVWSPSNIKSNSLHLKDQGFVTVEERMNNDGDLEYVGIANVRYHYLNREDN